MTDQPDLPQGETRSERQKSSDVVVNLQEYRSSNQDQLPITFHRRELDMILRVYGRMVGEGEWRDYAMDHLRDKAVFSVFKRRVKCRCSGLRRTRNCQPNRAPSASSTHMA